MTFAAVAPTATESLVLSMDLFDDATSQNKRVTVGLRSSSPANIVEMGMYNNPAHYAVRTALFASGPSAWGNFLDSGGASIRPVRGWHHLEAIITPTLITFTLDLGSDGSIDSTITRDVVPNAAGFNTLQFGGPSGVSSAGGSAGFDNIRLRVVSLVPEPSSVALLGLGLGAVLMGRRVGRPRSH